jgi:predicted ABC-type transport system involved in lysophospholipase L1 biosynthesis ATPase subunit
MLDEPSEGYQYFMGEAVHLMREKQRSALYKKHVGFVFRPIT